MSPAAMYLAPAHHRLVMLPAHFRGEENRLGANGCRTGRTLSESPAPPRLVVMKPQHVAVESEPEAPFVFHITGGETGRPLAARHFLA